LFAKKGTGRPSLNYEDAVQEALCYGWIDSIIKKIDGETYCRKFTRRRSDSQWSESNRRRVAKLIRTRRMTSTGMERVRDAKKRGLWEADSRPVVGDDLPPEFAVALRQSARAKETFERLAPSYRKHFIGWIMTAKLPATRERRIRESVRLLEQGRKLGLK
jgi:uncharacterized protein YdeI (YjbR/CyaY-like superfamily)